MKTITVTAITAVLIAMAVPASAATFYKWVDSQGTTHYGDSPPQGVNAKPVHTYNSASSDQSEEIKQLDQRRAAQASDQAKAANNAGGQQDSQDQQSNTARCDQLRKNLDVLTNKPIVRTKDPKTGKIEVIDQQQRQQMLDETRKGLQFCDSQGSGG